MSQRALRLAAAIAATAAITGCSVLGIDPTSEKVQYESSNSRANLEVPPDLTPIASDDRFQVPARQGVVSANAEAQRQQAAMNAEPSPANASIVPLTVQAKVMKEGASRWLRVNATPEQLWPVVQDFWPSVGLIVREQNPKTGYMETEWAENRAKLPQDIIRRTIGRVIDFAYSTGEQDQYRTRMERNDDGTTDIFVTHRSMVEVVTGAQKESTVWQPGPSDPTMEAEMLQRLALRIDSEFNPDASGEAQAAAQKELAEQLEVAPAVPKATIENGTDGKAAAVVLTDGFDQSWRRVGVVLDRMGFEQIDRDRTAGWFLVRYLDPAYEAAEKEKRGFFANLFSSDSAVEAPQYRIHLGDEGMTTRITVQNAEGGEDETGVAPNILTLLAEQLR
ncbi:outer membrane protein assembly factor BamC [Sutterella sp.]|uniref:outer membrane protein assembly factor BamC n=1 Tax=Sutterella sp. TaxID=1981025 RepID=UPI0026E0FBBE|nr:outer membrane protein assembly factor BamC [Sutterella sp.]MDO5532053.1 outer membrane protein assembly factor BamC [Sutterella sp.]